MCISNLFTYFYYILFNYWFILNLFILTFNIVYVYAHTYETYLNEQM